MATLLYNVYQMIFFLNIFFTLIVIFFKKIRKHANLEEKDILEESIFWKKELFHPFKSVFDKIGDGKNAVVAGRLVYSYI